MVRYDIYFISCGDCGYVGRTNNVRRRMCQHGQPPIWAILETVDGEDRSAERERFWKRYFESHGVVLLNRREVVCGFVARPRPLKQLTWLKEQVSKYWESNECLLWPHSTRGSGYGQVPIGEGKADYAHIVAWKFAHPGQIIPKGMDVMHSEVCISRRCFNQNHLTLGTRQQNMDTAKGLGRMKGPTFGTTTGENNGRAKLSAARVLRIRQLYMEGMSQRQIARKMGVVRGTIQFIVTGKNWAHLLSAS
jgi:hypothetical protein